MDWLTGVVTRSEMYSQLSTLDVKKEITVFFIDLDNFKTVNDLYGHTAGDEVLKKIGAILKSCADETAENVTAVRMGGDEFLLLFTEKTERKTLVKIAENIYKQLALAQENDEILALIGLSMGIIENRCGGIDRAVSDSDFALYEAKDNGKNHYVFYDDIKNSVKQRKLITDKIRSRLEQETFRLGLKPIYDLNGGKVRQLEIHMIWYPLGGEEWYPAQYLPITEKSGLSRKFDIYLFEQACAKITKIKHLYPHARFSFLMSEQSLLDDSLGAKLSEIITRHSLSIDDFDISVSEAIFDRRGTAKCIEQINRLSEMGFTVTLAKFGENFYSIKFIKYLPLSMLKIDPSYMNTTLGAQNPIDLRIMQAIIDIGKEIGYKLAAGTAKTRTQAEELKALGFDCVAGKTEIVLNA